MGLAQESHSALELRFSSLPADVAEEIIEIVNRIGKVKRVSRETGLIEGKITEGVSFVTSPELKIQISRMGDETVASIVIRCRESVAINYRRAEKAMRILTDAIHASTKLTASGSTGW